MADERDQKEHEENEKHNLRDAGSGNGNARETQNRGD